MAWYWACLVGEGRPLVTVIDHEVALPKAPSLEIRADGLWADHIVETPFDHMTLGCEAFAVAVDDPAEVYGDLRGDRVPFGFDLEWETDRDGVYPWIGTTRYEVSVQRARRDPRRATRRSSSTASASATTAGACATGGASAGCGRPAASTTAPASTPPGSGCPASRRSRPATCCRPTASVEQIDVCTAEEELGEHGFPTAGARHVRPARHGHRAALTSARSTWSTTTAPVTRHARFPRALCRFETADGRSGVGWTEWNQPET